MTFLSHFLKRFVILLWRMLHHTEILKNAAFWRKGSTTLIKFVGDTEVNSAIDTTGINT